MRENRTYGSEGGEASAFPTLSGSRQASFDSPTTHNPPQSTTTLPPSGRPRRRNSLGA